MQMLNQFLALSPAEQATGRLPPPPPPPPADPPSPPASVPPSVAPDGTSDRATPTPDALVPPSFQNGAFTPVGPPAAPADSKSSDDKVILYIALGCVGAAALLGVAALLAFRAARATRDNRDILGGAAAARRGDHGRGAGGELNGSVMTSSGGGENGQVRAQVRLLLCAAAAVAVFFCAVHHACDHAALLALTASRRHGTIVCACPVG